MQSKFSYIVTPLFHYLHLWNAFSALQDLVTVQNAII